MMRIQRLLLITVIVLAARSQFCAACRSFNTCLYKRSFFVDGEFLVGTASPNTIDDTGCDKDNVCHYNSVGAMLFSTSAALPMWNGTSLCLVSHEFNNYTGDDAFSDFFQAQMGRAGPKDPESVSHNVSCWPLSGHESEFHAALKSFVKLRLEGCGSIVDRKTADYNSCKTAELSRPVGEYLEGLQIRLNSYWECVSETNSDGDDTGNELCSLTITRAEMKGFFSADPPSDFFVSWTFHDSVGMNVPTCIFFLLCTALFF